MVLGGLRAELIALRAAEDGGGDGLAAGGARVESQVLDVATVITRLECFVVHTQLVAALRMQDGEVSDEPEEDAGEQDRAQCAQHRLVGLLAVDAELDGLAKRVQLLKGAEDVPRARLRSFLLLWHQLSVIYLFIFICAIKARVANWGAYLK